MKKIFICKVRHNGFKKGEQYTGLEFDNSILFIKKDVFGYDKKYSYSKKIKRGCDCINTWLWTLENVFLPKNYYDVLLALNSRET